MKQLDQKFKVMQGLKNDNNFAVDALRVAIKDTKDMKSLNE